VRSERSVFGSAKLHCSVGTFDADDPRLEPLWAAAEARAIPIVVHAGHGVHGRTDADELAPIDRVATAHPRLPLGDRARGTAAVDEAFDLLEKHPALLGRPDERARVADDAAARSRRALHDRLLFGSDCPNTTFTIAASADCIRRLDVSERARRAILGENARRLT
jgi:predicted TIM-barrel fold metal-dependent hydrolase